MIGEASYIGVEMRRGAGITVALVAGLAALAIAAPAQAVTANVTLENPHLVNYPGSGELIYRLHLESGNTPERFDVFSIFGRLASPDFGASGFPGVTGDAQVLERPIIVPLSLPCSGYFGNPYAAGSRTFDVSMPANGVADLTFTLRHGSVIPWQGARYGPRIEIFNGSTTRLSVPEPISQSSVWRVLFSYSSTPRGDACLRGGRVRLGKSIEISGTTSPPLPGQFIDLMARRWTGQVRRVMPRMTFRRLARVQADAQGNFSFKFTPRAAARFGLKLRYPGQLPHLTTSESAISYFNVAPPLKRR